MNHTIDVMREPGEANTEVIVSGNPFAFTSQHCLACRSNYSRVVPGSIKRDTYSIWTRCPYCDSDMIADGDYKKPKMPDLTDAEIIEQEKKKCDKFRDLESELKAKLSVAAKTSSIWKKNFEDQKYLTEMATKENKALKEENEELRKRLQQGFLARLFGR